MLSAQAIPTELPPIPVDSGSHTQSPEPPNLETETLPSTDSPESPPMASAFDEPHLGAEVHSNFIYNKHNESIFDDFKYFPSLQPNHESVVKFDHNNPDLINSATLKALIVQLTSPEVIDYNFVCDFFLTYRIFSNSETILNLLLTRFIWCLQYIRSNNEFNLKIGKLSLLRTFVVLRHWLLNYFIDDFEPNHNLCDIFISSINSICLESNLINNSMIFEKKIVNDLKIHWISLLNEFWKVNIDLDHWLKNDDVLNYKLPLMHEMSSVKTLSKSNTEISIHTNPSYRRSAMLSLYDTKVHHKCLIIDDGSDENPQFSVNNLLLQYNSSRLSLNNKLQEYQLKKSKSTPKVSKKSPNYLNLKHNYMSLKDSSIGLKKVSTETSNTESNNKLKDQGITILTPSLDNETADDKDKTVGFSTNGHLKLPTSKVQAIVPPTPVKKMDFSIKQSLTESPKKRNSDQLDSVAPKMTKHDEFGRKNSIKKLVDGWKKTFSHGKSTSISNSTYSGELDVLIMNVMTKEQEEQIGERVDILSARIIDELEYLIRYYIQSDSVTGTINEGDDESIPINLQSEPEENKLPEKFTFGDEFVDVEDGESAIVILGSPSKKHKATDGRYTSIVDLRPLNHDRSPIKNNLDKSITEVYEGADEKDEENEDDDEININNLSDLNIGKIDNLINIENEQLKPEGDILSSLDQLPEPEEENIEDTPVNTHDHKEVSFQRPVSINWNDDELVFENSEAPSSNDTENTQNESVNDNGDPPLRLVKSGTQYFDVSGDLHNELLEVPSDLNDGSSSESSDPAEVLQENFQKHDSFESSISTPSNMTQYDAEIADLGIALSPQLIKNQHPRRISFNEPANKHNRVSSSSVFKRDSRNSSSSVFRRDSSGSVFKRDSMKSYISYDSAFSFSNASFGNSNKKEDEFDFGLKKKTGYGNLRMATSQVSSGLQDESENSKEDANSLDLPVRAKSSSLSSVSRRSISSRSSSVNRKSIRVNILGALTELPFQNVNASVESIQGNMWKNSILPQRLSKLSEFEQSSIFSTGVRSTKNGRKSEDKNSSSVAIPGISNYVLKELAAIPDESIRSHDPIEFALSKLEGKLLTEIVKQVEDIEGNEEEVQRILNEINNANTEDVIEFSSDIENMTQEAPLTPIKNKKSASTVIERFSNIIDPPLTPTNKTKSKTDSLSGPLTSTPRQYNIKNEPIIVGSDDMVFFGESNGPSQNSSPFVLPTPKVILDGYNLSSELLSVVNVMDSDSHISFVLSYDSKSLANHFTIIEKDMLQEIDWKELIELKWNKDLTPVNSWLGIIVNENYYNKNKGVNLVISRFNLMVNWIISEILLTKGQEERINIISRFIHIAQNCCVLQNFSTLMQIILALTSEKVLKLKDTWNNLPPGDILMLKNLEELSSPLRNFLNIRLLINQLTPSKGCIPFVGLYLSDLIFNAERPKYVKKSKTNAIVEMTADNSLSPTIPANEDNLDAGNNTTSSMGTVVANENEKIINFSRFRTSVHIVKSLSQCIEWSNYYKFTINDELLSKCLYIRSLDEDEMNYCLNNLVEKSSS